MRYHPVLLLFCCVCLFGCRNGAENADFPVPKYSDFVLETELAHNRSGKIDEVAMLVDDTLEKIYAETLPQRCPNWIAYHAVLMYGDTAYHDYIAGNADENLTRICTVMLQSDTTKEGPYVLRGGKPYPRHSGEYFMQEHHPDQFLNYLSMAGGTLDAVLKVDDKSYTMQDVLERSLLESKASQELDYTVLAYAHFLQNGEKWKNKFGEEMSFVALFEALLKKEEPACFGTHRLGALARTLNREDFRDEKLRPELKRQVYEAIYELKRSQRQDGCFAVPGKTPGTNDSEQADVYFTGHSVEWLMYLKEDFATDDWVVDAVEGLTNKVASTHQATYRNLDVVGSWESHFDFDGLCHAVSALARWRKIIDR